MATCWLLRLLAALLLLSALHAAAANKVDTQTSRLRSTHNFFKIFSSKDARVAARRSRSEAYLGVCTEEGYADWYLNKYPTECQQQFNNASDLHQLFQVYCDSFCGDLYFDYLEDCGGVGIVLTTFYTNLCQENELGVQCYEYFTSDVHHNPKPEVEEYCLPTNQSCTAECYYALESLSIKLGCCTNILYNQSVQDPVANYQLWEDCEIVTPGYCNWIDESNLSGSSGLAYSVNLISIATIMLSLLVLK